MKNGYSNGKNTSFRRKTILVVDDDPGIVESLCFLLEDAGYSVVSAQDGSVFNSTFSSKPDLILLDYWLPKENGGNITRRLKSKTETKHIPVILFSASYNIKEQVIKVGADDFIPKPYDIEDLLRIVKKHLS